MGIKLENMVGNVISKLNEIDRLKSIAIAFIHGSMLKHLYGDIILICIVLFVLY